MKEICFRPWSAASARQRSPRRPAPAAGATPVSSAAVASMGRSTASFRTADSACSASNGSPNWRDTGGGVDDGLQLLGLEAESRERAVAVLPDPPRLRDAAVEPEREIRQIELARRQPVELGLALLVRRPSRWGFRSASARPCRARTSGGETRASHCRPGSGHAGDEVVERDRVAMGQEDREDVDPALDLGWWFQTTRHGNDGVLDRVRGDS